MHTKLQEAINKAADRYFTIHGTKFDANKASCVEVLNPIADKTTLLCAVSEEKIKVYFKWKDVKYIADFFFEDGSVLIGCVGIHEKYHIMDVRPDAVQDYFKNLFKES